MTSQENTAQYSDAQKAMIARYNAAKAGAVCQRGPKKGYLKASCPPMGTDAAIYWQAANYVYNPLKVSMMQMVFMTDEQRAFFDVVTYTLEKLKAKN